MPPRSRLITSAELARSLGLTPRTIQRYRTIGMITPAEVTPYGHARWIEDDVREQMRQYREKLREEQEDRDFSPGE